MALDDDDRRRQTSAAALRAASFGDPLPERVARGIVLARLANLVEGHAAVSGGVTEAVAGLLDGRPLPPVPVQGNGGSGEILALAHLLGPLMDSIELGDKEGLALINGSPCAAALIADAALAARAPVELAYDVFAMSIEVIHGRIHFVDAQNLRDLVGEGSVLLQVHRLAAEAASLRQALVDQVADDDHRRAQQVAGRRASQSHRTAARDIYRGTGGHAGRDRRRGSRSGKCRTAASGP